MQSKPFLTPADVARELDVSSSTVLRLIHRGELPAIAVSERIYRIPSAAFEMFKAGTLQTPDPAPLSGVRRRPRLGDGEPLPTAARGALMGSR
jgi:excisionase family DNA binding protein